MYDKWVLAARARPCAARTRLFGLISAHRSFAASYLTPKSLLNLLNLVAHVKGFFFPQDHRGYEIWGPPTPCPAHRSFADPSGNNLMVKIMYRCHHTPYFFLFFFFIVFGSFLFSFFTFFSPFLFLLILLFLTLLILLVGAILHLLILLLLYFKLFVILMIYKYTSFWGVFQRPSIFWSISNVYTGATI